MPRTARWLSKLRQTFPLEVRPDVLHHGCQDAGGTLNDHAFNDWDLIIVKSARTPTAQQTVVLPAAASCTQVLMKVSLSTLP